MFGGNAKTHFQVIGANSNTTGYMMSPFGDERWDIDDNEKLRKIFKKKEVYNTPYNTYESECNNYQQSQPSGNMYPVTTPQAPRQLTSGYVHQSGTFQGYLPKCEGTNNYYSSNRTQATQNGYTQNNYSQNQLCTQYQQSMPAQLRQQGWQNSADIPYFRTPVTKHCNGLSQDELKLKSRITYSQPNMPKCEAQNLYQMPSVCGQCQYTYGNKNANSFDLEKNWKASTDVPVLIAGEVGYRPLGPKDATPNPFYPPKDNGVYMPLR